MITTSPETLLMVATVFLLSFSRAFATSAHKNNHQISEPVKTPKTMMMVLSRADSNSFTPMAAKTATNDMIVIGLRNVSTSVLANAESKPLL